MLPQAITTRIRRETTTLRAARGGQDAGALAVEATLRLAALLETTRSTSSMVRDSTRVARTNADVMMDQGPMAVSAEAAVASVGAIKAASHAEACRVARPAGTVEATEANLVAAVKVATMGARTWVAVSQEAVANAAAAPTKVSECRPLPRAQQIAS